MVPAFESQPEKKIIVPKSCENKDAYEIPFSAVAFTDVLLPALTARAQTTAPSTAVFTYQELIRRANANRRVRNSGESYECRIQDRLDFC